MRVLGVGLIGCGKISGIYLQNCPRFENLRLVSCADLDLNRAKSRAAEYGVPKACETAELLADPEVDIVLDLTVPKAHSEINDQALEAGKHVYTEKPLGVTREEGQRTLALAKDKKLMVGGAPDTFLGAGLQTCKRLIDGGAIGKPVSATAFMLSHGWEGWHPSPEFYYQKGGGPMMDMGPYYLTALISLLGPIKRMAGMAGQAFDERLLGTAGRAGERIPVQTATHVAGLMELEGGVIATILTSFDVWASDAPRLEIHGTEGSLSLPDPNTFGGPIRLYKPEKAEWEDVPITLPFAENMRGLGVSDLADAIMQNRKPRASGELCFHVLDAMETIEASAKKRAFIEVASTVDRPAAMKQIQVD